MRLRADPDLLQRTLLHHFVRERLTPELLRTRATLQTAAGGLLTLTTRGIVIEVDGVDVVPTPSDATNGLVYAIRRALVPPS